MSLRLLYLIFRQLLGLVLLMGRMSASKNRSSPCAVTAEIMFRRCRAPVAFTTGVCPTGAQVVPAW